mmetsp:Transcript_53718/g.116068  ORF Transcript_53718/g.116068 Transcript_53718/m.116068 type:complete len:218 (-) Transcript_53718:1973-2626(-)
MERQLRLLILLLLPPLLELPEFLQDCLGLSDVDPSHVFHDLRRESLHPLDAVFHRVGKVIAGLELEGPLLQWSHVVPQRSEPLLVVALHGSRLVHPVLVLGQELRHSLALLLGGHLDDVGVLQLVTASIDHRFQFVLQCICRLGLLLLLVLVLHLGPQDGDGVSGERNGPVVHSLHGEFLLVLFLLQLVDDLHFHLLLGSVPRAIRAVPRGVTRICI